VGFISLLVIYWFCGICWIYWLVLLDLLVGFVGFIGWFCGICWFVGFIDLFVGFLVQSRTLSSVDCD